MTYTAVCLGVSPYEVTCEMMTQWFASQSWKPETRKAYRNTVSSFFAGCGRPAGAMMTQAWNCLKPNVLDLIRARARTR